MEILVDACSAIQADRKDGGKRVNGPENNGPENNGTNNSGRESIAAGVFGEAKAANGHTNNPKYRKAIRGSKSRVTP
jgi:hypothetical protein